MYMFMKTKAWTTSAPCPNFPARNSYIYGYIDIMESINTDIDYKYDKRMSHYYTKILVSYVFLSITNSAFIDFHCPICLFIDF